MLIKTKMSQAILDYLKMDEIINLNILGVIDNVPHAEIYVDDITSPTGVFVKKDYMHYIYSKNDAFIDEVVNEYFKEGFYGLSGVEVSIAEKIMKRFDINWTSPCNLYYMPKENLDLSLIKNPVQSIALEDAEIVDKYYTYRNEHSVETIKRDIQNRPTSAIYVDGEAACWVLIHEDDSMGIMYTREEYRNRGLAVDVTLDLAAKIFERGKTPFLQIVKSNNMSPGLAKKCGFIHCGEVIWFGIVAGTPKEIAEENEASKEAFIKTFKEGYGKENFLFNDRHEGMYIFPYNYEKRISKDVDVQVKEAKDEKDLDTWCEIILKSYEIPEEEHKSVKDTLLNLITSDEAVYKCYLGMQNGENAVAAGAFLKLNNWALHLSFLGVPEELQRQRIGSAMLTEMLYISKKENWELISSQCPEKYTDFFKNAGMKLSHNRA
jgi:ribosomal protein S18 acetylase RimI-like enzyme